MEKEYMTLEEVAEYIGKKRATIYNDMKALGIKPLKFKRDRRAYISLADAKRIKEVRENPWIAGEDNKERGNHHVTS